MRERRLLAQAWFLRPGGRASARALISPGLQGVSGLVDVSPQPGRLCSTSMAQSGLPESVGQGLKHGCRVRGEFSPGFCLTPVVTGRRNSVLGHKKSQKVIFSHLGGSAVPARRSYSMVGCTVPSAPFAPRLLLTRPMRGVKMKFGKIR